MEFFTALSVLAAICVSGGVGFYLNKHLNAKRIGDATELATRIVEESRKGSSGAEEGNPSSRPGRSCSTRSANLSMSSRNASAS